MADLVKFRNRVLAQLLPKVGDVRKTDIYVTHTNNSVGIFPKWMISSIRSRICCAHLTPEAFSILSMIRDVPAALPHFIRLMVLITNLAFCGVDFHEGIWVPVKLYIWEALIVFFPGRLLSPVIQAQLPASLWRGFSPWTFRFSHCIWLARRNRPVLLGEGSLRTSCLAWNFDR